MNLTQLLLDIQTTRGMLTKQLTDLETQVKEAIEAEHDERMRQHAEDLIERYEHAPSSEVRM